METAHIAEPLTGDKLYQQRARKCLPILVRQAAAEQSIVYGDLAAELEMPNARNLNYVLGSIGQTLQNLSAEWGEDVPPIQCLVINKDTGLPGEGVGWFVTDLKNYRDLPRRQQRQIITKELGPIFGYRKWNQVLAALGLEPCKTEFSNVRYVAGKLGGGGESKEHLALKEFVASNPAAIELPNSVGTGEMEYSLPSGDSIDVFFRRRDEEIGVEVKSRISFVADITRGLFQCVKYRAVLEARQAAMQKPQNARTLLVLGGELPKELLPLKHVLDVQVFENIGPSA